MKHLQSLRKYFYRYKWYLISGIIFVAINNLLAVIPPTIIRTVIDQVTGELNNYDLLSDTSIKNNIENYLFNQILLFGLLLIGLALLRGIFMFFMRQTLIVMSRHIEYEQKKDIYNKYQSLDTNFFKQYSTGDLMNRLSEDVSRVRLFTGPSIMYTVNMVVITIMCIWGMLRVNPLLTLCVMVPLPILALTIFFVNKIIFGKSEQIQKHQSTLTSIAQESYSGIRVVKSFALERQMQRFFETASLDYKNANINMAKTEAFYFPTMNLFISLSMLSTVLVGGYFTIIGKATAGNIAEFVLYINLMMFPMFIIGWVANSIQRAAASQKRINEFMNIESAIQSPKNPISTELKGSIDFKNVSFTYPNTGFEALKSIDLSIRPHQKIMIMGSTGSGKSSIAQLLLRMYDTTSGTITFDHHKITQLNLQTLRTQISFAPQESLLFSDTIYNNIKFGNEAATKTEVEKAAFIADLDQEILHFSSGYETIVGERGVMLSGGQKQRLVLARALLKNSPILILDETLSAVDKRTEKTILNRLQSMIQDKTVIIITHRVITEWNFDQIIILDEGRIIEQGAHLLLMQRNGQYARLYRYQNETPDATN
jgi:ATP-binding cassette subfamily B multidrug efflux pump